MVHLKQDKVDLGADQDVVRIAVGAVPVQASGVPHIVHFDVMGALSVLKDR